MLFICRQIISVLLSRAASEIASHFRSLGETIKKQLLQDIAKNLSRIKAKYRNMVSTFQIDVATAQSYFFSESKECAIAILKSAVDNEYIDGFVDLELPDI